MTAISKNGAIITNKNLPTPDHEDKNIALLIIGNALTATTHTQILLEAKKLEIPFKVLLGVSVFDGALKSFLSPYNFGCYKKLF